MIVATVLLSLEKGLLPYGTFQFLEIPQVGHLVSVPYKDDRDLVRVKSVVHYPSGDQTAPTIQLITELA